MKDIRSLMEMVEDYSTLSQNKRLIEDITADNVEDRFISAETTLEIQEVLKEIDAIKIEFPAEVTEDDVYIYDRFVIQWDGASGYVAVEEKETWIWDVDPIDYFPRSDEIFEKKFWTNPYPLYHGTKPSNVPSIKSNGLKASNLTRGLTNRGVSAAVFTSNDLDELEDSAYGTFILGIRTDQMKKDGYMPPVSQEPEILENRLRMDLAEKIRLENFYIDESNDMRESTVIIYGDVPAKYLVDANR